ncbi:sigma-70 family RNA polymerase sigma factor [uncultured Sunxiuqinia sp.]|uniref:RNA polymerase sigma factor n=1 Tax=uncultured Sunxiuqinia sp. TaxID=1573825 RepID=UPI0030D7F5C5
MIDQSLNRDLKNGDASSYDVLYSLTADRLKNYCKIFIKDHVLVEDLVQNAYVRLWEKRALIKPDRSVESLLFTMIRNQCLNHIRDQKLLAESFSLDEYSWSELQHLYQIDFSGKEESTLEEQLFEALKNAIDQLPERQNQILIKCKIEGRRQQEVADELGISLKAVEKNLAKARIHLRQDLIARFPELSLLILMLFR